jgi:hypothetical protein
MRDFVHSVSHYIRANGAIDRGLPKHSSADIQDCGLTGRDTDEWLAQTNHEFTIDNCSDAVNRFSVGANLNLRVEPSFGIRRSRAAPCET